METPSLSTENQEDTQVYLNFDQYFFMMYMYTICLLDIEFKTEI